jgi:hypothetical protein
MSISGVKAHPELLNLYKIVNPQNILNIMLLNFNCCSY